MKTTPLAFVLDGLLLALLLVGIAGVVRLVRPRATAGPSGAVLARGLVAMSVWGVLEILPRLLGVHGLAVLLISLGALVPCAYAVRCFLVVRSGGSGTR